MIGLVLPSNILHHTGWGQRVKGESEKFLFPNYVMMTNSAQNRKRTSQVSQCYTHHTTCLIKLGRCLHASSVTPGVRGQYFLLCVMFSKTLAQWSHWFMWFDQQPNISGLATAMGCVCLCPFSSSSTSTAAVTPLTDSKPLPNKGFQCTNVSLNTEFI